MYDEFIADTLYVHILKCILHIVNYLYFSIKTTQSNVPRFLKILADKYKNSVDNAQFILPYTFTNTIFKGGIKRAGGLYLCSYL